VFYTGRIVEKIESPEAVRSFLDAHAGAVFVITNDGQFEKLRSHLPGDVTILDRRKRLLQGGDVVLLGRKPEAATAAKPTPEPNAPRH
jgi:hypothetical protein